MKQQITFDDLRDTAERCSTPKQFRKLLDNLRALIPYERLGALWGRPSTKTICYVYNHSMAPDFLRWSLMTGSMWKSPVFWQWMRTKRSFVWWDVAQSLREQIDPELWQWIERTNLQFSLCGGFASHEFFVRFFAAMPSVESGRTHLPVFSQIIPYFAQASQRAYPDELLTDREKAILRCRAMGMISRLPRRWGSQSAGLSSRYGPPQIDSRYPR